MSGVISTRNGVPPETQASDPPGGVPRMPDPETAPHPAPSEGGRPAPQPQDTPPVNQPPPVPPRREAAQVSVTRTTTVQASRPQPPQQRHK